MINFRYWNINYSLISIMESNLLFDHVFIKEGWHDSDGYGVTSTLENARNVLIFQTDHILSVNLEKIVIDQQTISRRRGIFH